tara:strand:+ start:809 stop:1789 length:981 start_codon:yes stop_codon:yes gene_type:complete
LKIGLQLTKNSKKYSQLLKVLKSNLKIIDNLEFIQIPNNDILKCQIGSLDILVTYSISKELFSNASDKLKWIHIGAAGIEKSLFPSIIKSRTVITNARGIHATPVSEFVLGIILYLSKKFKKCEKFKRDKNWTQWEIASQTIQLKGKTIGIIGYGKIGKAIAKKCINFDMKVIATRRLQKKYEVKKTYELIPISELDYLLENSDYIVIACPLTPMTKGLIGKKEINKLKPTAFLINIARGEIIIEKELINALEKKIISGAALDVFENEPLKKTSPFFNLDNIFLSPHISGNFPEYQKAMITQFSDNLNRFINGQSLKNRICKKRLY